MRGRTLAVTLTAAAGLLALTSGGGIAAASAPAAVPASGPTAQTGGLAASVRPDGHWQVTASIPRWTFSGSVGAPVSDVRATAGRDRVGRYRQLAFDYQANGPRRSAIRVYGNTPVVLFSTTYLAAQPNGAPFPVISSYPRLPYKQSYQGCFGVYQFNSTSGAGDSPWLSFDGSGNGFLISPASHFEQASTSMGTDGSIASGITGSVGTLPAGFTQQTMLTVGHGVNSIYRGWGAALTGLTGKARPASDDGVLLNKIGYWTDNGATYYYKYDPSLGYQGTLQAVAKDWAAKAIPLGYMQLDSWFYPKGPQAQWNDGSGGEYRYEASPQLFPDGLAAFHNQLGLPLVTHARWIDPSSPYHSEYQMSGNVVTDPRFWQDRMTYLHSSGVVSYEQDWLCQGAQPQYNLTDPDAFLGNMAAAAAANGMTMQYCMPFPRNYLQTALYGNLTNMRVSNDRFEPGKWDQFLFDSQLAGSLGVWPWTDVFMSTETGNLLLSDLSGGPVGVGDPIGQESRANIMRVARPDGVIVKPDAPILPDDQTYLGEAAQTTGTKPPMVATTYSDHGAIRDAYVFSYARGAAAQTASFRPSALGIGGAAYVYNYLTGQGSVVPPGGRFQSSVTGGSYWVVAPLGRSGIAFLGDAGKFVSLGSKRISALSDDGAVHATVAFARGEGAVTLHGYSPAAPRVTAARGTAGPVGYDPATGMFTVRVAPPAGHDSASVTITRQQ